MTFERSWVLFLAALLPLALIVWQRRTPRKLSLGLKAAMLAAVLLALAEPRITTPESKVAAVVLVDTSGSVNEADLDRASKIVGSLQRERGRHNMQVIPFARTTRDFNQSELQNGGRLKQASGDGRGATDLEAAVRDAIVALPADRVPRIVLISDGNENQGSVARAAWFARQTGAPVDTYSLSGLQQPLLRIESITLPATAFTGEQFPIDVVVSSPKKSKGNVELTVEGKAIGSSPVSLAAGNNQFRVHARVNMPGAVELSGKVSGEGIGETTFKQAVSLRKPRILYISQDPEGTETHLLQTLAAAQFDVQRTSDHIGARLDEYQLVVFNNWDLESIPEERKKHYEEYVKQGGGLLVIGGERNVYMENKKLDTALDRTLPAKLAPPRSPEGTCVVLIVDKSSSMEGRKMDLARLAAIGVIDNVRPVDQVGVLIFDNTFSWAVPIRRAEDRGQIKRLIAGITPDGGTQIAPALSEAYRKIAPVNATFKHVVLLTDGISEEGDSMNVAKEASSQKVTISTVGLGQDVNKGYLEKVATLAKGRSYFLTDPAGLEQILIKDVLEHTGSTAVEKPVSPVVMKASAVLEGVGMESAPPLRGYVRFVGKPTADTILTIEKKDPLYAVWQYGLGRSAIFASDAKSRWAERWVVWPGFDKFWLNVFRDLLPHAQAGETTIAYDNSKGSLIVNYRLAGHVAEPSRIPGIFVFGPGGFRKPVDVKKIAERSYRGEIAIAGAQGLFRIRPLEESRIFPETGIYREEQELTVFGSNEALLRQVSQFTGGRHNPDPASVFEPAGRSVMTTLELWPGLLGLGILLNLIELVLRKWSAAARLLEKRAPAA